MTTQAAISGHEAEHSGPNYIAVFIYLSVLTAIELGVYAMGLPQVAKVGLLVALAWAKERGAEEALFLDTRGNLSEGTGSNVFVVVDGEILTPDLASGPLAGVTRELVVQWCRQEGLTVREEPLPMSILKQAAEVFITSSTKDVLPVHAIDDQSLAAPGPVTARAAEIFERLSAEFLDP